MLQMCLKCPHFWSKHVWNSISAPDWPQYDIPEITPHEGGRPGPHPEKLKFQIWPSSLSDKCNLILWWKLSFLWKSEPDPTHLRGVLSWFSCWWYPRYMHSPIHVFWAWYVFLNEYTTYFSFCGAHSRQKYGLQPHFCLIGQNMSKS